MHRHLLIAILLFSCVTLFGQAPKVATPTVEAVALLAKTKALYDTPFQGGLLNFDCAIDFDFEQHLKTNFGDAGRAGSPLIPLLQPIKYRVFVDRTGASVSAQPKLPDFTQSPVASQVEESNRTLMQIGLTNWVPYAYGEVLPLGPTNYQFEQTATGYNLSMDGRGITGKLTLDHDLRIVSGVVDTSPHMHLEMTTQFVSEINGLVLGASSTDTNHAGVARFTYTYQSVDGFELPQSIGLTSEPNKIKLKYTLTDCKTQHRTVLHLTPSTKP